jgi:hypothetical protein
MQESFDTAHNVEPPTPVAVSEWPNSTVKRIAAVGLFTMAVLLIGIICTNALNGFRPSWLSEYAQFFVVHLIEILMLMVIVAWLAFATSNSWWDFLKHLVTFGTLMFAMLALVLSQTRMTFWLVFLLLLLVGLQELTALFRSRTILKGSAQVLFIAFIWLTLLHLTAQYLLAVPTDFFATAIAFVTRIRLALVILFGTVVVLATIANVLPRFSWPYRQYMREVGDEQYFAMFVQPIFIAINALLNFIVNFSTVLFESAVEVIKFIKEVFFDRDAWRTVFNVSFIAFWAFAIAYVIASSKPSLTAILTKPSVLTDFNTGLMLANLLVGLGFLFLVPAVLGLSRSWFSRDPSRKFISTKRVPDIAVVIYLSVWAAAFTYFYLLNMVFGLHEQLWVPGIFTILVIPLGLAGLWLRPSRSSV